VDLRRHRNLIVTQTANAAATGVQILIYILQATATGTQNPIWPPPPPFLIRDKSTVIIIIIIVIIIVVALRIAKRVVFNPLQGGLRWVAAAAW